jgi:hypothetical protein
MKLGTSEHATVVAPLEWHYKSVFQVNTICNCYLNHADINDVAGR